MRTHLDEGGAEEGHEMLSDWVRDAPGEHERGLVRQPGALDLELEDQQGPGVKPYEASSDLAHLHVRGVATRETHERRDRRVALDQAVDVGLGVTERLPDASEVDCEVSCVGQ